MGAKKRYNKEKSPAGGKGGAGMAKQDAQISFRATKEFKRELEERARQERLSASGLILKALQAYLHPQEKEGRRDG